MLYVIFTDDPDAMDWIGVVSAITPHKEQAIAFVILFLFIMTFSFLCLLFLTPENRTGTDRFFTVSVWRMDVKWRLPNTA